MAATGTSTVVPSGKVTFTIEPGSPMPDTVSVPLAFADVTMVGAGGGVVSVKLAVPAGEALPAASVATAETVPDPCGAALVAE